MELEPWRIQPPMGSRRPPGSAAPHVEYMDWPSRSAFAGQRAPATSRVSTSRAFSPPRHPAGVRKKMAMEEKIQGARNGKQRVAKR